MNYTKHIQYDVETRDFAMYLNGELTGFARTYQEAEALLDAQIARIKAQAPAPAPVVSASLPVTVVDVETAIERREREAVAEAVTSAAEGDAEGVKFATVQLKALKRAREALGRARNGGHTLVTELVNGDWLVRGSQGDRYTVRREGIVLHCDCRHGQDTRAALAGGTATPRGQCWHVPLVVCVEEGIDAALDVRDLAASLAGDWEPVYEMAA